jgi:hypothetical protein
MLVVGLLHLLSTAPHTRLAFVAFPNWQQFRVGLVECKMVNKIHALLGQPISDSILCVLFTEVAKVFRVDDRPLCFGLCPLRAL